MEIFRRGVVDLGLVLKEHAERPLEASGFLRSRARLLAADRDRQHDAGKEHEIAHGQDDERILGQGTGCPGVRLARWRWRRVAALRGIRTENLGGRFGVHLLRGPSSG
jgi:hypothetical protein